MNGVSEGGHRDGTCHESDHAVTLSEAVSHLRKLNKVAGTTTCFNPSYRGGGSTRRSHLLLHCYQSTCRAVCYRCIDVVRRRQGGCMKKRKPLHNIPKKRALGSCPLPSHSQHASHHTTYAHAPVPRAAAAERASTPARRSMRRNGHVGGKRLPSCAVKTTCIQGNQQRLDTTPMNMHPSHPCARHV